jgi:hypothetical protein
MEIQDISSAEESALKSVGKITAMVLLDPIPQNPSVKAVADSPAFRRKDLLENFL